MSGSLAQQVDDPCTSQARSAAELWRMWLRVGRAILLRAAPPLTVWRKRAWERRMLAHMTERDLKDIGLTRQHAAWAIDKPFWKA